MYELIVAAAVAIATAIAKGVRNAKARLAEEGLTSAAFIDEGKDIRNSGWQAIEQGYNQQSILRTGIEQQLSTQKQYAERVAETNKNFDRTMLYILLGTAAVVIAILILRSKK